MTSITEDSGSLSRSDMFSPKGHVHFYDKDMPDQSVGRPTIHSTNSELLHFLPPLTTANYSLLSKVLQEKKQEEDMLNIKRVESIQISKFIADEQELPENPTYRVPAHYTEEYVKYLKRRVIDKLLDEELNPINEYIRTHIRDDKRFPKEVNEYIRRELFRRVHELKILLFQKMEKKREKLDSKGVFDPSVNRIRVRSMFKVELQKLAESVFKIHREIVNEMEERHGIVPEKDENFIYSREGRIMRKSNEFLDNLRPKSSQSNTLTAEEIKRNFSFLPGNNATNSKPKAKASPPSTTRTTMSEPVSHTPSSHRERERKAITPHNAVPSFTSSVRKRTASVPSVSKSDSSIPFNYWRDQDILGSIDRLSSSMDSFQVDDQS